MKTYSFKINNNTKKNSKKITHINGLKDSFSSLFDSILTSNIINNNPYLIDSDIINATNKGKKIYIINDAPKYDYDNFNAAMNYLANLGNDSYDFELTDGTPIKIFDDEIQIGYTIIPIQKYSYKSFLDFTPKTKKTIIDIYIKLSK